MKTTAKLLQPAFMFLFSTLIYLIPLIALGLFPAYADSTQVAKKQNLITRESPYSVSRTMDNFENIVKKKGFTVFARIDHKENAKGANLTMNEAQVLIFGNPKGGTLLMNQDIRVALDLPLRVVVYQTDDNKVYIAYHNPNLLPDLYQLSGNKVIPKISKGLDKLTSAAVASAQ